MIDWRTARTMVISLLLMVLVVGAIAVTQFNLVDETIKVVGSLFGEQSNRADGVSKVLGVQSNSISELPSFPVVRVSKEAKSVFTDK